MRNKEIASLIKTTRKKGSFSDEENKFEQKRDVYINTYSTSLNSIISAANENLDIKGRFELWSFEYSNEEFVEIAGKKYKIISSEIKGDKTIITYGDYIQ